VISCRWNVTIHASLEKLNLIAKKQLFRSQLSCSKDREAGGWHGAVK
jgi:hypothetical protein